MVRGSTRVGGPISSRRKRRVAQDDRRREERTGPMKTLARALTVVLLLGATVSGIFVMEEVRKVPVGRLAENIQRQLRANPRDVQLQLNLARLYAMAYALKVTEFDARRRKG